MKTKIKEVWPGRAEVTLPQYETHLEDGTIICNPDPGYVVVAQSAHGERWIHNHVWADTDLGADLSRSFADKVEGAGEIDTAHWWETYPDYCSPAGREAEAEEAWRERRNGEIR